MNDIINIGVLFNDIPLYLNICIILFIVEFMLNKKSRLIGRILRFIYEWEFAYTQTLFSFAVAFLNYEAGKLIIFFLSYIINNYQVSNKLLFLMGIFYVLLVPFIITGYLVTVVKYKHKDACVYICCPCHSINAYDLYSWFIFVSLGITNILLLHEKIYLKNSQYTHSMIFGDHFRLLFPLLCIYALYMMSMIVICRSDRLDAALIRFGFGRMI